ncbi:MAG: multifunctional oxoglutarate decarboxylase/oxoglutarate dehydrogenase thiamine pyrophosphate-binding subunit/dihydrolipoyllysine-residue succinyltransferase subunit [Actinomycetota bacterium]|jgi:multifunctional 2-oxoglutarate metabolism enzyme
MPADDAPPVGRIEDFGPNVGLVEEIYRQWLEDPNSVAESWQDFFADYKPRLPKAPAGNGETAAETAVAEPPPVEGPKPEAPPPPAPAPDGATPLKGAAAMIVKNMQASLTVPTATSARVIPAGLLEVNRRVANNYLVRVQRQGKISFTHLIGWAVVKGLQRMPVMNSSYTEVDGKPGVIRHSHVNLGLAVDVTRADGSHSLLVPNIKAADTLDFDGYFAAYEDIIRRVRSGKIGADDFAGTTVTLTNPGTIGTVHSVPRLMPGQGAIIGVGTIDYPAEYQGADPRTLARLGLGKVVTLTSTYDHRIIQGAESGEFLKWVHQFLLGAEGFYDEVFASLRVPYEPARWKRDSSPDHDAEDEVDKQARVLQLINIYRVRGHLIADLDPLGRKAAHTPVELDPIYYGLTIWDLERSFATGGLAGSKTMKLVDILGVLRDAYSRTVGIEYMHIQDPEQKEWIQQQVEGARVDVPLPDKRRILERLNAAEAFERFLHTKYLGHKRFGLEGAESLIPMLDAILNEATAAGMDEAVLGMAHRGRLNVLANIVGKSYSQIFREFEGNLDPASAQGSGDVKYHLGATGVHRSPDSRMLDLTLASNPSHLEAVDPVVEGMTRAKQDRRNDTAHNSTLAVLIHGDAAFAGQGVVAETFNLSQLPGYRVGGTVHIVVNNQVGFTTAAERGRSSLYATDVAKMVQAPIFHVNGDDPEACVRVARLAFAYRARFARDVVIDMVCYRRHGHNEADEPAYTQPRMYALIEARRSVRKLYTESLINRGDITLEEAEAALHDFQARLEGAFAETRQSEPPAADPVPPPTVDEWARDDRPTVDTATPRDRLETVIEALTGTPDGFTIHPKLVKQIQNRRTQFEAGTVDWALAESLAFGTLLLDGTPVRLAGQDSRRGTFSQRHAVLVDFKTEAEHVPLAVLGRGQAPFRIYDSLLSEYAALGFDYGYSVAHPEALVLWEAQFGDFVNGGQIIIDQFITAAEDKWGQESGLVLLLPHAFEGQGPEHSSARLERFLSLCAEDNLRVAYPTTAANYFHLLRAQALARPRKPLVVMTPKRYLRMPASRSAVSELTDGRFTPVLGDREAPAAESMRRVVLCTGKVGHELIERRNKVSAPVAVLRLDQLYPFPAADLKTALEAYPGAELVWAQEEPENMGAWSFIQSQIRRTLGPDVAVTPVAREESGSPATGSQSVHDREQDDLLTTAVTVPS